MSLDLGIILSIAARRAIHFDRRYIMQTQPIPEITPEDIQQNKTMGILAYILFFIPLLAAKESKFGRYHANQGLILQLTLVALWIVQSIISGILAVFAFGAVLAIGAIFWLVYLALSVLAIIGIINAAQGQVKPVPVLGSIITIIK